MDPYEVLGVSRDASAEEIKRAYRKKAREYHPDLNPDDETAAKRMNEVNEAYDRITNPEKYANERHPGNPNASGASSSYGNPYSSGSYGGSSYGQGQQTSGSSGPYDWVGFDDIFGFGYANQQSATIHPEASATDSPEICSVINDINSNNFEQAIATLTNIPSTNRDARWYYLSSIANRGAGNTVLAFDHIHKAVQMDPNNSEYSRAERTFQQNGEAYQQEGRQGGFRAGGFQIGACCCGIIAVTLLCSYARMFNCNMMMGA